MLSTNPIERNALQTDPGDALSRMSSRAFDNMLQSNKTAIIGLQSGEGPMPPNSSPSDTHSESKLPDRAATPLGTNVIDSPNNKSPLRRISTETFEGEPRMTGSGVENLVPKTIERSPKTSFGNTMRRTSRFFRMLGGNSTKGSIVTPMSGKGSFGSEIYDGGSNNEANIGNRPVGRKLEYLPPVPSLPIVHGYAHGKQEDEQSGAEAKHSSPSKRGVKYLKKRNDLRSEEENLRKELQSWQLGLDGILDRGVLSDQSSEPQNSSRASPSLTGYSGSVNQTPIIPSNVAEEDHTLVDSTRAGLLPATDLQNAPDTSLAHSLSESAKMPSIMIIDVPSASQSFPNGTDEQPTPSIDGVASADVAIDSIASSPSDPPLPSSSAISSNHSITSEVESAVTTELRPVAKRTGSRQSVVMLPLPNSSSLPRSVSNSTVNLSQKALISSTSHSLVEKLTSNELVGLSLEEQAEKLAEKCWQEDATFLPRRQIAEWLGSLGELNSASLTFYMKHFDFVGLRLDMAFRRLCDKLYLKAETQQVDRILVEFSRHFYSGNPNTVYRSVDVIHAVSYSVLLLNTDLHVVDSNSRMTRMQFVRNTVEAIRSQSDEEETTLPKMPSSSSLSKGVPQPAYALTSNEASGSRTSLSRFNVRNRASQEQLKIPSQQVSETPKTLRSTASKNSLTDKAAQMEGSRALSRPSDTELELTLKEMYNAVRSQPIFQPSESAAVVVPPDSLQPNSPYGSWNSTSRSASRRSASSTISSSSMAFKRSSIRGFSNLLNPSSSSSAEFMRSASPTPTTATSFSDDNHIGAYGMSKAHHHVPTIGFASNLSHSIIREQLEEDSKSEDGVSVTDEELALSGAPWAKEGLIYRKHYWVSSGRRAKEKNWLQVFVVISKGELRMFRFEGGLNQHPTQRSVGGGDWASNAQGVGELSLSHALCSAMPLGGYSKDRPHCFVLTLPSGGSYFFQAGTQDLVSEWVATCNYWAARLSKEPLVGGVSNMEFGWNRASTTDDETEDLASIRSGRTNFTRNSNSSNSYLRSFPSSTASNSNDRINIMDWNPPEVPTGLSTLPEESQLESLRRYISTAQDDLLAHNQIRQPMLSLYSPRSANAAKALANWERKAQHLMSENVKYQTYIDALTKATQLRSLKRGQKEVQQMLLDADDAEVDETRFDAGFGASSLSSRDIEPRSTVIETQADLHGEAINRASIDTEIGPESLLQQA